MALVSDAELRRRLQELGMDVGPVTDTTRSAYQRALRKRQNEERAGNASKKPRLAKSSNPTHTPSTGPSRPLAKRRAHSAAKSSRWLPERSRPHLPPPKSPPHASPRPLTPQGDEQSPGRMKQEPSVWPNPSSSHSPLSSSPPSYFKRKLDFSPSEGKPKPPLYIPSPSLSPTPPSPPPPSSSLSPMPPSPPPPPSPSSPQSPGGLFSVVTNWIEAGVKKIAHQFQPLATPRPALRRHSNPLSKQRWEREKQHSPKSSPRRNASYESIPIDEVDMLQLGENPGPSRIGVPLLNPVPERRPILSFASPARKTSSAPSQRATPLTYDWELLPSDVEICMKADRSYWRLGKGGFGEVYKGVKDGLDEVAVKVIRIQNNSLMATSQFKQEIDMISKLRHRNIVQFYGACIQPTCLYMVTELMEMDLFSALGVGPQYQWTGLYGKGVMEGIASGLHYLHSRRPAVVHRDIKSPNILLMNGLAKIADVGIARTKASSDMTAQRGFTVAWAAPEVVYRKRATEKIDIWSLGIVLWEVVSGGPPKPGHLSLPEWAPDPLQQLYRQCVEEDAEKRPSAAEVVQRLKQMK